GQLSQKSGESLAYQALIFTVYSVILYSLVRTWPAASTTLMKSAGLLILICSSMLSYIAAGAGTITLMKFVLYLLTISAALAISSRYNIDEVCETFFFTSVLIIILYGLAYPFLNGQIEYDQLSRANLVGLSSYAGLFPHKNSAAEVFSFCFIV